MSKKWTNHRLDQLHAVQELINECNLINKGGNVIGRLQRIEKHAKKLEAQLRTGHKSFVSFLIEIAHEEPQ